MTPGGAIGDEVARWRPPHPPALVFCKLQKVTLLLVEEYTDLLALNCYKYIYST
ncbi:hypothetical protein Hanom_Chr10g00962221 [Helianthus anomalus]